MILEHLWVKTGKMDIVKKLRDTKSANPQNIDTQHQDAVMEVDLNTVKTRGRRD